MGFTPPRTAAPGVSVWPTTSPPCPTTKNGPPGSADANRFRVTLGGGYKFSKRAELNLACLHVIVDDPEVDKTATGEDQVRGAVKGTWDASVDVSSVNLNLMV